MSFFKNLFGGKNKKPDNDSGPMPTRPLNMQYSPLPENGYNFAQQYVDAVKTNENKTLDYSVESLQFVDQFLQRFSDEGLTVNDFAETIFVAGAYVGEVMVRNNNGRWIKQEDANLPAGITMMPIVVQLPNGAISDPIAKAFKRFHYGAGDEIRYFYQVSTTA